jgi:drug/metabolite transporter (DMT)-like permease
VTHDVRPLSRGEERLGRLGPQIMFAAALLFAAAAWVVAAWSLTSDHTLPLVATLLFALAGIATLVAWSRGSADRHRLTYWDVAGALTFIGIGAAALIDPEQMLRLLAATPGDVEALNNRR